jgi:hypothetical protein
VDHLWAPYDLVLQSSTSVSSSSSYASWWLRLLLLLLLLQEGVTGILFFIFLISNFFLNTRFLTLYKLDLAQKWCTFWILCIYL